MTTTDDADTGSTTEWVLSDTTTDGVLVLTLNDPGTRNALGPEMMDQLVGAVEGFDADSDLRCLVITGAAGAFCSGANVRGFQRRIEAREEAERASAEDPAARPRPWETLDPTYTARETGRRSMGPEIIRVLHNLQKPSIAAVNGPAYGLGCGLALTCDIRIAGRSARFSEAFIRNGLIPADGSTWQLPKLIGVANTLWMQYTGDAVGADDAYRIGLVNRVVDDDELLDSVRAMATRLAGGPTYAMGLIKQLVHQGHQQDLAEHLPIASRAQDLARGTDDHKEGVAAFLEKRPPRFTGR